MQHFGSDEPRKEVADRASSLRNGPAERVDLKGLQKMLGPMSEDYPGKNPQRQLMSRTVQTLEDGHGLVRPAGLGVCGEHLEAVLNRQQKHEHEYKPPFNETVNR